MREPLQNLVFEQRRIERMIHDLGFPIREDPELSGALGAGTRTSQEAHRNRIDALNQKRLTDLEGAKRRLAQLQAEAKAYSDRRDALMAMYAGPSA